MDGARIGINGRAVGRWGAQRLLTGLQFTLTQRVLAVTFAALAAFTFQVFT